MRSRILFVAINLLCDIVLCPIVWMAAVGFFLLWFGNLPRELP
jgi:hypothetical protein